MTAEATQRIVNRLQLVPDDREEVIVNFIVSVTPEVTEKPKRDTSVRIGAGKGKFNLPEDFDDYNEEIYAEIERYALS